MSSLHSVSVMLFTREQQEIIKAFSSFWISLAIYLFRVKVIYGPDFPKPSTRIRNIEQSIDNLTLEGTK